VFASSQFEGFEFFSARLFFGNITTFFIGRFTGIVWQAFPAAVCTGAYLFYRRSISKKEKIAGDGILLSLLLLAVLLIIAKPLNYFGGRGFAGNRYFFILPALLFLPAFNVIKKPQKLMLMFLPGLCISSQILINENLIKDLYFVSRNLAYTSAHAAHTLTFPLKYAPLEIPQVEFLGMRDAKISNDMLVYAPLGLKSQVSGRILVGKGQEVIFVPKHNEGSLTLNTDRGELILQPKVTLKSKSGNENKKFYYFKAKQPTWINALHG
jgi:hypothetical protein